MLLNSASTEMDPNPSSTPLNPEPLWQLEFGSCWERMQESANSPVTSNPRDAILDLSHLITESGSSATESDSDVDPSTSSAGVLSIPSLKVLENFSISKCCLVTTRRHYILSKITISWDNPIFFIFFIQIEKRKNFSNYKMFSSLKGLITCFLNFK